jgi:hypothetical protein
VLRLCQDFEDLVAGGGAAEAGGEVFAEAAAGDVGMAFVRG